MLGFWDLTKHIIEHAVVGAPAHAHNRVAMSAVGTVVNDGVSAPTVYSVFRAPVGGATIQSIKVITATTVTTHATDDWTVDVHNPTDTVSLLSASRTTTTSAFEAGIPWDVGAITNGTLEAGDVVQVAFTNARSAPMSNTSIVVNWD